MARVADHRLNVVTVWRGPDRRRGVKVAADRANPGRTDDLGADQMVWRVEHAENGGYVVRGYTPEALRSAAA